MAVYGKDKGRLGGVWDARVIPDLPAVEGDPIQPLADFDVGIGHGILEVLLVFAQAFRPIGIADIGDFLVGHFHSGAIHDGWERGASGAGFDFVHTVGDAVGGPDDPVFGVPALVVAVAFLARVAARVLDVVPLPMAAVDGKDVVGGFVLDVHVVAADAPQPAIDGFRHCHAAGFRIRVGGGNGVGGVGVVAVVEVRPLAGHGDGEPVCAVGEGDRAVHVVDGVAARAKDENRVAGLKARILVAGIRLDDAELVSRQFAARPDDKIRRTLLHDGKVDPLGNRVGRRLAVIFREISDGEVVGRKSGINSQERRSQRGGKSKDSLSEHSNHPNSFQKPLEN